jgi:hypothetical protein
MEYSPYLTVSRFQSGFCFHPRTRERYAARCRFPLLVPEQEVGAEVSTRVSLSGQGCHFVEFVEQRVPRTTSGGEP